MQFLIHAPRRGATQHLHSILISRKISIHTPRGGSDIALRFCQSFLSIFQSTLPVGGATQRCREEVARSKFQSTLPVGGATICRQRSARSLSISIHAPRGGSDSTRRTPDRRNSYFNPRSPWGERPLHSHQSSTCRRYFNPRSPWGERHSF